MLKKEFEFILQDKLIYSHDGKAGLIAKKLLLCAPNTKLLSLAGQLNAVVMSALMKAREHYKEDTKDKNNSQSSSDMDGEGIYMLVASSITDKKNMDDFIESFIDLLLSDGICLIDGKEPLVKDLLDNLDSRETLRLIGDYIANFLLPSIMNQSKKTI